MKKTIITVAQAVERRKVTSLTLGGVGWKFEGLRANANDQLGKPTTQISELGKATNLTLGSGNSLFEGPDGRPARKS
jgi:hypothetical protein